MTTPEKRCVVCSTGIEAGAEEFANAWERSLGRNPCCSATCVKTYDPEVHWVPPSKPSEATQEELDRLLRVTRERIAQGDQPRVVVREMLQAGMPVESLRKVVFFSSMGAAESKRKAAEKTAFGVIVGFITGHFSVGVNRDPRDEDALELAQQDLDVWDRAFGVPKK